MDEPPPGPPRPDPSRRTSPTPPSSQGSRNLVFDVASWHPKSVKRPRPVKSCTECRRRKLKCDRLYPCSQCQRSGYRVCAYGSGGGSTGGSSGASSSTAKPTDPNQTTAESEGSEGSAGEHDDSAIPDGSVGERPLKRHLSRPPSSGTGPQPAAAGSSSIGGGHPPSNSSLSILLNPPSPSPSNAVAAVLSHTPLRVPLPSATPPAAGISPSVPTSLSALSQISSSLENSEHLLSLNDAVREYTSTVLKDFTARLERVEQITSRAKKPPIAVLSDHDHDQHGPRRRVIDASSSATMRSLIVRDKEGMRTRFYGPNSTRVLLNLFDDARDFMSDPAKRSCAGDLFGRLERIHNAIQEDHLQTLKPITVYVDSMMPVQKRMADILPRREVCDRLFDCYVNVSEGLYRVVHVPTFRQECEAYWANGVTTSRQSGGVAAAVGVGARTGAGAGAGVGSGVGSGAAQGVSEDFLPRLLCILCIGSRFETDSKGLSYDRSDSVHIPTACALVRSWLDTLRCNPSVDVITLQTEVLLLHANRMISPRPQRLWVELGVVSRLAMAMGLHRDPSEFTEAVSPFQGELRRKLWYTILDMDLHVALTCSMPSALRPGEFTCQPPRNLDDADLRPDMAVLPPTRPMDQYTEGQMQRFAATTLALRMRANDLLCRIDALTDYDEVLRVGRELERALDDINYLFPRNAGLGTHQKHKEWRMRAVLDMHVRRPLLALYRPFALSAAVDCPPPPAISDMYLKSSMAMMTYMKELDPTQPGFDDISYMYYVILRNDIVQAAFSICYYIMQAVETEARGRASPISGGGSGGIGGSNTSPALVKRESSGGSGSGGMGQDENEPVPGFQGAAPMMGSVTTQSPRRTMHSRDYSKDGMVSGGSGSTGGGIGGGSAGGSRPESGNPSAGGSSSGQPSRHRNGNTSLIWTSAHMIRTVELTIENLARLVHDLSFDLRDVVALAVVLGSVMPAAHEAQRNEHIRMQIGRVLDTCVEKLRGHTSHEVGLFGSKLNCRFAPILTEQIRAAVSGLDLPRPSHHVSDWYNRPPQRIPSTSPSHDKSELLGTNFWDLWSPQNRV